MLRGFVPRDVQIADADAQIEQEADVGGQSGTRFDKAKNHVARRGSKKSPMLPPSEIFKQAGLLQRTFVARARAGLRNGSPK